MRPVHVLLPVHNRKQVTLAFVRCLKAQTYPIIRLMLIDDGSTDGTSEAVRGEYPSVDVIRGNGAWWWAGCLQRGLDRLKQSSANGEDIVFFANDDTTFDADFVQRAVGVLTGEPNCMLLARFRDPATGEIRESGIHADLRTMQFQEAAEPAQINCLSTRGLFARWSSIKRTGDFHPRLLPHYLSDYEYTIRALRRGIKGVTSEAVWLEPNLSLTASRDLSSLRGWRFLRVFFSPKYPLNPVYWSSFVILACPPRWIARNFAFVWWRAAKQLLRQLRPQPSRGAICKHDR